MEPRFGHDFSQVRVHADTKAAESAEVVKAKAYTVGRHVVIGEGQPSPETIAGRQLLAHELAHVVQQSGGGGGPAPEVSPSAPHETDACAAATAIAAGRAGVQVTYRTGVGLARQENVLEQELLVARDLVIEELGDAPTDIAQLQDRLRDIGASESGRAADARRVLDNIEHELGTPPGAQRHLREAQEAADRFLRQEPGAPPRSGGRARRLGNIVQDLERAAPRSGPRAAQARELLERIKWLRNRVRQLEAARRAEQMMFQPPGDVGQKVKTVAKIEPKVPAQPFGGVKTVPAGGPATTVAGAATTEAATTAAGAATTEGKAATRLSRVGSGVAKFGTMGFHLLMPGPLDALMLMVEFAGSYAAAHEAIRSRNTRTGFAIGLSAFLLGRSFGAVRKHLTRKSVLEREVHTQVLGAVGMAETSHNAGLSAGFHYGELLSDEAKDALREAGFAALAAQGRLPERQELFTAEGVWQLSGALLPTVDQIFEAMRVESERRTRAEFWQRRLERGGAD
jgi:hypothetical protein